MSTEAVQMLIRMYERLIEARARRRAELVREIIELAALEEPSVRD